MKTKFLYLFLFLVTAASSAQSKGKIVKIENFKSDFVQSRNVEVWLPPGYDENKKENYPVLYMHDGQNVFNKETTGYGTAWEADDMAEKMIVEGKIKPFIIVASWHTNSTRYMEYFPEKASENFTEADKKTMTDIAAQMKVELNWMADEYLKFMTAELKPYIDKNYRTLSDTKNTSVCGSSMGGLISMYAISEYPNVFGQAACVSTHWPVLFDNTNMSPSQSIRTYMEKHLPSPKNHHIYFDYGTETLDQYYELHQNMVDDIMKKKGYTQGKNWVTRKFEGAEHSEKSWQVRMDVIYEFLYGKK